MELGFLQAYILTLAIETAVLFLVLKYILGRRYDASLIVRNSVIASSLTLPFVWFFFPRIGLGYMTALAISELFAFGAESAVYRRLFSAMDWRDAAIASFLCNMASFMIGLMINYAI